MMVAIFGIMLLVLALVDSSVAATALMYDDINCPSNELNSKCVNLEENSCCISGFGQYFWSVMVIDIDQDLDYSIMSDDTTFDNVFGASWFRPTQRTRAVVPTRCTAIQHADIYYISVPGAQRKPYSITLAKEFDGAGAVNWSTHTFNADKLDVVQGIIAQHTNNLDQA
jgi:hypothetical protein